MQTFSWLFRSFVGALFLTTRFALRFGIQFVILGISLGILFHLSMTQLLVTAGFLIVIFFIVAFVEFGRGGKAIMMILAPAGIGIPGVATAVAATAVAATAVAATAAAAAATVAGQVGNSNCSDDDDFDTGGNMFDGFPGASIDTSSAFDDDSSSFHPSFNTNGLPMIDDVFDIHGNVFGTNSNDDMHNMD